MAAAKDLSGMTFGKLSVLERDGMLGNHRAWKCLCACGKIIIVRAACLTYGTTQSCGCLRLKHMAQAVTRHGQYLWPEYRAWQHMKERCYNKSCRVFHHYGGRGILVCEQWMHYEAFIRDMGRRPFKHLSLDRSNNELGYCPHNCRWATKQEQVRNRRVSVGYVKDLPTTACSCVFYRGGW